MRPLRGLIACLGALLLLTVILIFRRASNDYDGSAAARTTRSRFRTLLAFHTPESLFPPSAIVSLTDDNSTFFLARPAAFGSSLPSSGLSGQLWVGGGFKEEGARHRGSSISTEGELGCGDIPGWPFLGESTGADGKESKPSKSGTSFRIPTDAKNPARAIDSVDSTGGGVPPSANDGTDDYLHWPLKGAPLSVGAKLPQSLYDDSKGGDDKGHADIQSIQETAEIAGKVVLLSRGGCGFLEKTKWVQRRGGVALIVGDNVKGAGLITMYANGDTSNVTIPSIFTSHVSAQLLSSLVAPGENTDGRPVQGDVDPIKTGPASKKGGKMATKPDEKAVAAKSAPKSGTGKGSKTGSSWFSGLMGLVGLGRGGDLPESRRFPDSGRINWQENSRQKQAQSSKPGTKSGSNVVKKPHGSGSGSGSDGFVIGVHDWRDPDLVALQQEAKYSTSSRTSTSTTTTAATAATAKVYGDSKGKGFSSNNAVPGSGRYSIPGQGGDQTKPERVDDSEKDADSGKWYNKLFSSEVEVLTEEEALGLDDPSIASSPKLEPLPISPIDDSPDAREGLWVTITPTTISASPFFDTLLVLVVSPLVTLTVVYALLLLRARIQRRRWRAPKSVVERLPVRIYHTMSSSSTSSSSQTPSVDASATSPLLQADQASTLSRTRPRSRTTTSVNESAALSLERQREDLASRYEKKRYRGRQVECAVCLEDYVDGQSQVMSLPCGHDFHAECITPWLTTRRRTCPICKGDVVRSMAAASSADRSASSSPQRTGRIASRAHSLDRSGTPQSDTPLLQGTSDDLERGRGGRPQRSILGWLPESVLRYWEQPARNTPEMADRDR